MLGIPLRRGAHPRRLLGRPGRQRLGGEGVAAGLEGQVGEPVEVELETLGARRAALPGHFRGETIQLALIEVQLDGGAGQIPGDVLRSHEVVAAVVIEGVRLEDALFRRHQPLPGVHLVVGEDGALAEGDPGDQGLPGREGRGGVRA